ncbi:MAG: hypothetical protein E6K80_09395, partial [Candidatus Eisenbacteria bacterium]
MGRVRRRHREGRAGNQHRDADRVRPAVPGPGRDPPRGGTGRASRAPRQGTGREGGAAGRAFKRIGIDKGDVDAAFLRDDVIVVEGSWETGAQEQLYIEPQGMVAVATPDAVTVWGSLQCPYYVHKALGPVLGLPPEKVRVIQTVTGGGFGGKEEYPNVIAGHAALLSWKAGGRPVKLVYDRLEDMWATTKRHPSRTTIRSGFTKDGRLLGLHVTIEMDGG